MFLLRHASHELALPGPAGRAIAAFATALVLASTPAPAHAAEDILQKSRAMYSALRSYADTGAVISEYGSSSKDRHTFTTYISRTPRGFYFDFRKEGGDRYVIWGDPQAFHTWWKTTGLQDDYPNPNNVGAFTTAGYQTSGSAMKIPTMWFPQSVLQGPLTNFTDPVLDGTEEINGHRCHRVIGSTRDVYTATGREVNVRKLTVWFDVDSLLIRKVLEDAPKGTPAGQLNRTTTTFAPVANPALDGSRFQFVPPEPK